ncbi:oxysterol-binding protein [Lichtheimia corymbifera JMRC:FSU:9682]|uniref:Oxysterol-binding protein n=1 Tax=Lichtheimia corymbifera JMRC:FSU:9682 TaxID=1263082 RepID=A0A068S870_9FUNG|nr:oxysterol-binding protein [Lichtheimia corymbifera JMRC:FSU:9682]
MEVVQVQPRDSYLHYIYVPTKGTAIRWSFTTRRNNIAFGVYRRRGQAPLPSSSEIIFHAQQQRQHSAGELLLNDNGSLRKHQDDDESENGNGHAPSLNGSIAGRPRAKSVASTKLREQGLDEIIPIQHMNSSSVKIEGSYVVEEPGNYVLVFDNTFSRNKAKTLTFSVALVEGGMQSSSSQYEISGWLLKKKRKKMQGWAKRWFQLSPSGVLSYSISPTSVTRGSIQIMLATISSNPDQRLIHIDSGTMLYHLKTLTIEDHDRWTDAFRAYRSGGNVDVNGNGTDPLASSDEQSSPLHQEIDRGLQSARGLGATVDRFAENINVLKALLDQVSHVPGTQELAPKIAGLTQQLERDRNEISTYTKEQQNHWQVIHEALSNTTRSAPTYQNGEFEPSSDLNRMSTSARSSVSDLFYDAEDIILSGGDDDFLEEGDEEEGNDDDSDDDEDTETNEQESDGSLEFSIAGDVVRRNCLPSHAVGDVGSALSVFRKNVGKDLSTISMPISMNEPLSMLQRACEELEYCDLLDKASTLSDSMDRLIHIAIFAVSSYASSQYRTGRKPFNPMMTETYECIRPDKGFRFISEKVSHNPLIVAAYAEAKKYKYWQSTKIKSKFWGKSMEFMTEGTFHVTLTGQDDHFTYNKPSSWMRNMIAGEKYLETAGEMRVTNHATGEYATVTFKEGTGGGLFGAPSNRNDIVATFFDSNGKKCRRVVGKWSDKLSEEVDMNKRKLNVLWTANPPGLEDYSKYYGFTRYCVELNEITEIERDKIPITDTRYRPDQRLYENGLVDEADAEKQRIEQKQRERRKEFEQQGVVWKPRWFTLQQDAYADPSFIPQPEDSPTPNTPQSFQYTGQYWQCRETGQWPSDMFELW